jgi:hypothetical protein
LGTTEELVTALDAFKSLGPLLLFSLWRKKRLDKKRFVKCCSMFVIRRSQRFIGPPIGGVAYSGKPASSAMGRRLLSGL